MRAIRLRGRDERIEQLLASIGPRPLSSERVAIVTMVRDELDVLPSFLTHHLQIVDRIHIVDHRSVDGTREYLERVSSLPEYADRLAAYFYDHAAHNQVAVVNAIMRRAFAESCDWVLPIDGDEFLPVSSPGELRDLLAGAESPVARLDWVNLMPKVIGDVLPDQRFDPGGRFERISGDGPARYGKVVLHRSLLKVFPAAETWTGQHKLRPFPTSPKTRGVRCGDLLHVPARSVLQVRSKRTNFTTNPDFERTRTKELAIQNLGQRAIAERLAGERVAAAQAREVFESVIIPYEPKETASRPREEWIRRETSLPATAIPSAHLRAEAPFDDDASDRARRRGSTAEVAPSVYRSIGGAVVVVAVDRSVTVQEARPSVAWMTLLRIRGELRMLASPAYFLSLIVRRPLELLGRFRARRR